MHTLHTRTRLLTGDHGLQRLQHAHVAIIGIGGVGGHALEAIARAGIGRIFIADPAHIDPSNLNRQILALTNTIGRPKTQVALERIHEINPHCQVQAHQITLTPENIQDTLPPDIHYAIDAIDDLPAKLQLIRTLHQRAIPFITCMGAGAKLNPTQFTLADLADTHGCPLAKRIRQTLRKEGIHRGIRCIYSTENQNALSTEPDTTTGKRAIGSISYMPAIAGLMAAGVIINDILQTPIPIKKDTKTAKTH